MDRRRAMGWAAGALLPAACLGGRLEGPPDDGPVAQDGGEDSPGGGPVDVTRFAPGCKGLPSACGEFDAGSACWRTLDTTCVDWFDAL